MRYFSIRLAQIVFMVVLAAAPLSSRAQWMTQAIDLKAGWNAVFLNVDASHATLNDMVGSDIANPIIEVWRWNPPSVAQFTDSPASPTDTSEWTTWRRTDSNPSLQRLNGDTAYLVHVGTNVATYTWRIQGRPVVPRGDWTISGLNLIGFPTVPENPPKFNAFLAQAPELKSASTEVYAYLGGDLGPSNPVLLPPPLFNTPLGTVRRGQAYWMRSGTVFNHYFGPFQVVSSAAGQIDFGDTSSSSSFRLRNLTTNTLVVTLRLVGSELPPAGQPKITGEPPLILRGSLNLTNLTYGYTNLPVNSPRTLTLAPRNLPGSEVEVVLGLNRTAITAPSGAFLAGVLRLTDSLGFTQIDMPVSATVGSRVGLWVGDAVVTQVGQYLKSYAMGSVTNHVAFPLGASKYVAPSVSNTVAVVTTNALLTGSNGRYILTGINTNLGNVPQPYPLRLIVHNPEAGSAVLLQRVYHGMGVATNAVVATGESALHPSYLKAARRISAAHLPWTANNNPWPLGGRLGQQTGFTTTITLAHDDQQSNPFLHTYHPDHDNLTADFKNALPQGAESYTVERVITLTVRPPADDFASVVAGAGTLTGDYAETMTLKALGTSSRQYNARGVFTLNRVSQVPALTLAP